MLSYTLRVQDETCSAGRRPGDASRVQTHAGRLYAGEVEAVRVVMA